MDQRIAHTAIRELLGKRARIEAKQSTVPMSKHPSLIKRAKKDAPINSCLELCSLLLARTGTDLSSADPAALHEALSKEYSPRALELLVEITAALGADDFASDASDVTSSSDFDTDVDAEAQADADAVVPSFHKRSVVSSRAAAEAVVPHFSPVDDRLKKSTTVAVVPQLKPVVKEVPAPSVYKSETEIAIGRIFNLGKVAAVQDKSIPADAPYFGPSVVSMTGFGELGRFGNQVVQYMFLRAYATRFNIDEIQVPSWVGASLFGLSDRHVQRALPAVVEFRDTLANSTFTTDFIDYVKKSNPGKNVPELFPNTLGNDFSADKAPRNVDVWGWFQWHTSHFAPCKQVIQDTFEPVAGIKQHLSKIFDANLRYKGGMRRTVVGLHLRLGDYQNIAASSFGYCAPTSWYLNWLEKIWPTLENPILFLASDDINAVLRDFSAYSPVTGESMGMHMPAEAKGMKAGFFPDWFSLTQCDVLAISNSTFSFSACLMNQQPDAQFFRAHYLGGMEEIDPWNADPIVHRDVNKGGISSAIETLQVVYKTQGSRALVKNLLYELPYYGVRSAIMKAVLWKQAYDKTVS